MRETTASIVQPSHSGDAQAEERTTASPRLPDHQGLYYLTFLERLHHTLSPRSYFEIGTHTGNSLRLAQCGSVAVDPQFLLDDKTFLGGKPFCHLFQMPSDLFFKEHSPTALFGHPIDIAFLDGMHRCEFLLRDFANTEGHCAKNSIIAMHDCLPVEPPMADRAFGRPAIDPRRQGWWAGDVWRTLLALRKWRPDLAIFAFDAPPTGLVLVTNLAPKSDVIWDHYNEIVTEMMGYDLDKIGVENYFRLVNITSTSTIDTSEKLTSYFWL